VPDWSTVETQLAAWVANVTGMPCYWSKRPTVNAVTGVTGLPHGDAGRCILTISGRNTVGNDMIVFEYDSTQPATAQMRTYQRGQRNFTLSVQVRTYRQTVDLDAKEFTDRLRDRTGVPSSAAFFDAADIAFAKVLGETDDLTVVDRGREMSVAQIDLRFNGSAEFEDTATTWIEHITNADCEIPEGTLVSRNTYDVG
jgi:hypothetical protein